MNLKEYFRLANLFGKLNSQEKLEDDFTTMPEGETLRFFWESCEQEKIDASSIIERTRMKIQKKRKEAQTELFVDNFRFYCCFYSDLYVNYLFYESRNCCRFRLTSYCRRSR